MRESTSVRHCALVLDTVAAPAAQKIAHGWDPAACAKAFAPLARDSWAARGSAQRIGPGLNVVPGSMSADRRAIALPIRPVEPIVQVINDPRRWQRDQR